VNVAVISVSPLILTFGNMLINNSNLS
jgi:hypothetical protein